MRSLLTPPPKKQLLEHVQREFLKVKRRQAELLGLEEEKKAVVEHTRSKL